MTLLHKLLIIILSPFLLISLAIFFTTTFLSNSYLASSFSDKSITNLLHIEQNIQQHFNQIENDLRLLARISPPDKSDQKNSRAVIDAYINRALDVLRISLVDLNGEEWLRVYRFNTADNEGELESLFYSPVYQVPLLYFQTYLGNIEKTENSVHQQLDLSIPIKDLDTGETAGVVWAKLSFQTIYDLLERNLPEAGRMLLVHDRKVVVAADATDITPWTNQVLIEQVATSQEKQGVLELNHDYHSTTLIYRRFAIKGNEFTLILAQPNQVIYALASDLQLNNILIFTLGILSFAIFITWIIKRTTRPLSLLNRQMRQLSKLYIVESRTDEMKDHAAHGDEIHQLQHSFTGMRRKLKEYRIEEENFKQHLENEVEKKIQHIRYQAYHDSLTGLPNRRLFNDRLEMAMAYAKRHKQLLAVIFLDLDNFKNINDTEGHHIGDLFLAEIAKRLLSCSRDEDTVSRFGGDEFTFVLPDIQSVENCIDVAKRILEALAMPINISGHELVTSTSIGITFYPQDGTDVNTLIKNADIAMYSAKQGGKNNYAMFSQSMNDSMLHQIAMEKNLRKAIARDEFLIHYQPKVHSSTGKIISVEALIRWKRDEYDLVSPEEFIPIAEESNLIILLGEWVLKEVCCQAHKWHRSGHEELSVAVNISARQFQADNFIDVVKQILSNSGMRSDLLNLEITENTVMNSVKESIIKIKELRAMGIQISIDDFGTGYSSLSYLKQFPVNELKIDRSFVKELPFNQEDAAITKSIISMAHSMGLRVIAEGVETSEQRNFLQELNCDLLQGFYFSRPIATKNFTKLLNEESKLLNDKSNLPSE